MAKKPITTKTTGPLHFEDLEPHRFEDLIRRLIYDFRQWRHLEPTGRTGSDDGFDVRGFERALLAQSEPDEDDLDDEEDLDAPQSEERIWLVQCKREKTITPAKLKKYLDEINPEEVKALYGIIFAAACDFSKKTRDLFRAKTREMGFAEAYLWGKGELEDMLYQPKNDDILFTFFGVSLRVRRRSISTDVRRRLVMKRKVRRLSDKAYFDEILIRDANDDRYPWLDKCSDENPRRWMVLRFAGCNHDGVWFTRTRQFAFIAEDGKSWDRAELMNDAPPHENPWRQDKGRKILEEFRKGKGRSHVDLGQSARRHKGMVRRF